MNDDDRVLVLRRWWEGNGTSLVVMLVLVIGGVIGWRWYNDYTQTRDEAASATYQRYLEARQRDAKPEEVATILATLDNDFRTSAYRVFTLFYRAHDAADAENLAKATEYLETAVKDAKDDRLRAIARLRLARLQMQVGNTDAALETLRKIGGDGFRSYVAELKGDILLGQNKPDEAREAYQAAAAAADKDEPQPVLQMKIVDLARPDTPPPATKPEATTLDATKPDATKPAAATPDAPAP
jgi:predicted negative regulator of RcsB-dependent stress response